jgi:rod shape-determining protein MreC
MVLAAWLVLPFFAKRILRLTFFEFQAPLDLTASYVRDLQEFWSLRSRSKSDLIAAGRDLAQLNATYEVSLQQMATLRGQVSRLEAMLRIPATPGYQAEPARVVRRDLTAWWQRIVVRKGRMHGIPVGAPVIYTGGVVGKVVEVGLSTSVVELISSPTLRLSATLEGDTRTLSYQGGQNPTFGPAVGVAEFVPLDVVARHDAPRRVVTSGLGGVFPPGLTVGDLIRVDPGPDGLFRIGEVRLDARLAELMEVTILVPESP